MNEPATIPRAELEDRNSADGLARPNPEKHASNGNGYAQTTDEGTVTSTSPVASLNGNGHSSGGHKCHPELLAMIRGVSRAMRQVRKTIEDVATTNATVLISGPSGTGKELVAKAIHKLSRRKDGPFVPVNVAALPEGLAESALFGHEKGAFTNAVQRQIGYCQAADSGTLFLDEISEMPVSTQPKLLRFIQERTIQTLGHKGERPVDVRLVAAMNRDPKLVVSQGLLREDLFFRLSVVPIHIPPLRERPEDIEELAKVFLKRAAIEHDRDVQGFSPEALAVLTQFDWPGNVRQLENAIERIAIFARNTMIDVLDIPAEYFEQSTGFLSSEDTVDSIRGDDTQDTIEPLTNMQQKEKAAIVEALQACGGHVVEASQLLGIGQATMYRKIKQYGIPRGPRRRRPSSPK